MINIKFNDFAFAMNENHLVVTLVVCALGYGLYYCIFSSDEDEEDE